MATTVTMDTLRELAGFRAVKSCAISLYLDLDPQTTINPGDIRARVNSLLDAGGRGGAFDSQALAHDEKRALKDDLERIRSFFNSDFDRDGARAFALFCSGLDNLWRPLPLAYPVTDDVRLSRELYLAPLVPCLGRGEGALVAVIGRERGELYRLRAGRLEEVVDQAEETPGQHDQGGWSQANYQRHIDELVVQHLKRVLEQIDRRVRRDPSLRLVIVANESVKSEIESRLSAEAQRAVVGWTSADAHADGPALLGAVQPLLDEARAREEREALDRWREEAGRDGRATAGWEQTLEAASDGRVELLLVDDAANHEAFQCPACGRGQIVNGNCPLDGTRMEPRPDGVDLAVHQTLAHGGAVRVTETSDDLGSAEGIGALLRY